MNRWKALGAICVASLATCLPARAEFRPQLWPVEPPCEVIVEKKSEITGKLRYVIYHWRTKELIGIYDKLPDPISRSWAIGFGITTGGKTIDLTFATDALYRDAEKWVGLMVKVAGKDQSDHVAADTLTPLEARQTNVRIKGFLDVTVLERFPELSVFRVKAEGRYYTLTFATNDLRQLALGLGGRRVFINGTFDGTTITVKELQADETGSVKGKVEINGVLQMAQGLDRLLELASVRRPHPFHEWHITAESRTFWLTFATPELEEQARKLVGKPVVIKGRLEGETVTVEELRPDTATHIVTETTLEMVGKLSRQLRPVKGLPPHVPNPGRMTWVLEVEGGFFDLILPPALEAKAEKFEGRQVRVIAKDGEEIEVAGLVPVHK